MTSGLPFVAVGMRWPEEPTGCPRIFDYGDPAEVLEALRTAPVPDAGLLP